MQITEEQREGKSAPSVFRPIQQARLKREEEALRNYVESQERIRLLPPQRGISTHIPLIFENIRTTVVPFADYTDMKAERYSGDSAPEARTAYIKDAVPDSFLNNAFAQGGETFGQNIWFSLAETEKKPDKPTPAVTASKTAGLVAGKPVPTPCAFQRMSRSAGQIFASALIFPKENVKVTPVGKESLTLATKGDMAGWPIAKEEFYWAPPKEDPPCTVSWVEQKMTISPLTQADKDWLKVVMEKAGVKP